MEPPVEREPDAAEPAEVVWDRIAWRIDDATPEDLERVRAERDDFVPRMIASLRAVAAEPARYAGEPGHHGHECALAYLAEFRAAEAFPAILGFLGSISGYEDALIRGDIITEDLPSILAATFDGNLDGMKAVIADEGLDEFVRGAALVSIAILVRSETLAGAVLSEFLAALMERLARTPSIVWDEIATQILQERLVEHRTALERMISDGLTASFTPDDVTLAFDDDDYPAVDLRHRFLDDAVETIEDWLACYWTPEDANDLASLDEADDDLDELEEPGDLDPDDEGGPRSDVDFFREPYPDSSRPAPFVRSSPKVGRNDPCPCGSGRKYKRCCADKDAGGGAGKDAEGG